jgi:predicted transcriptional regulator
MRQVGISLPSSVEKQLLEYAKAHKRSMSSVGAEAIEEFLDGWVAPQAKPRKPLFGGIKLGHVQPVQESA